MEGNALKTKTSTGKDANSADLIGNMFLWALFAGVPIIIAFWFADVLHLSRASSWALVKWALIVYFVLALWQSYMESVGKGPKLGADLVGLWMFCIYFQFLIPAPLLLVIFLGWIGLRTYEYLRDDAD